VDGEDGGLWMGACGRAGEGQGTRGPKGPLDEGAGARPKPAGPRFRYLMASGLIVEPVPPVIASGGPAKKNS
jgi:hypothetical protein